jgi:hypothetical protein
MALTQEIKAIQDEVAKLQKVRELVESVDQFDDLHWVKEYGANAKGVTDALKYLDEEEIKGLLREYWAFVNKLAKIL